MSYVRKHNIRLVLVSTAAIPPRTDGHPISGVAVSRAICVVQAVKELPHPHPPVAFGFRNVKPAPIMLVV